MQYFQQASETQPNSKCNIFCTLVDRLKVGESESYFINLTNDLTKEKKQFVPFNIDVTESYRYRALDFRLVYDIADEDLSNGLVHFEPTGSYTWEIGFTGSGRILEKGKAIVYPNGEFSTAHKFGDEVNYTEHLNPTTNTVYIQE